MNADTMIHMIRDSADERNAAKYYFENTRIMGYINACMHQLNRAVGYAIRYINYVDSLSVTQNEVASAADDHVHILPDDFLGLWGKGGLSWEETSGNNVPLIGTSWKQMLDEGTYELTLSAGKKKIRTQAVNVTGPRTRVEFTLPPRIASTLRIR